MAKFSVVMCLASSVLLALLAIGGVRGSDPELTNDFFVPEGVNVSTIDGGFFTFTGFRNGSSPAPVVPGKTFSVQQGKTFSVVKAFSGAYPALTGLGVASAFLDYLPGGLNPPHTHPRGTELLYVIQGSLSVGFIDSSNKLFSQVLQPGDLFVFPKGLVHYQINTDPTVEAKALSAFSSSNPGLVSLPATLFGAKIDHRILADAFSVTGDIIRQLQAPFAPQP